MSISKQLEILNDAHKSEPIVSGYGVGLGACSIHRWRTFLTEYSVRALPHAIIAIQLSGRSKIRYVGQDSKLSDDYALPGNMTVLPSGTPTKWSINGEFDAVAIIFEDESTKAHLDSLPFGLSHQSVDSSAFRSFSDPFILGTAKHLIHIFTEHKFIHQDYVDTIFKGLEMYSQNFLGETVLKSLSTGGATYFVGYALQRLTMDIRNKIHIEDIAKELRISPSLLSRTFKDEVGVSPHDFLLNKRLERARKLLSETDLSIAQVAFECGFANQSHMTRYFSAHVGLPPFKYRKHMVRSRCE